MIKLLQLNKLITYILLVLVLIFYSRILYAAEDIWKKEEKNKIEIKQDDSSILENTIALENIDNKKLVINEETIEDFEQSLIGIFDPETNNFNLEMWAQSDGLDIKKILNRIDKIKLSKFSEDLLFQTLFTNSYPPKNNLSGEEFLKIKIDWLIKKKRFKDIETLLKKNSRLIKDPRPIKILVDEYLSSSDVEAACAKTEFLSKDIQNDYIDKFIVYCLIKDDRKDEAQLLYDLMIERGFKDKFFENKFYYLLGLAEETSQKILDNNLLNFYLSYITSNDFSYQPSEDTDKHIWKFMSSGNLLNTKNFENEEMILTYEKAAYDGSFENDGVFKIYLQLSFTFNQLINSNEIYKNLPNYKARALIYQSMLLTVDPERKIYLSFLLKDLFIKDKIFSVYKEELSNILKKINPDEIPEQYQEIVNENIDPNYFNLNKAKFDNSILHKSKIIRHFFDNYEKTSRTEKDFKTVYKKVKKNKKYFISIMDIIVLESLVADGVKIPSNLDYKSSSSELIIPKGLEDLVSQQQIGMVLLKVIEIIGEDKVEDLDPETVYFLTKILNQLNLKKIRNNILNKALQLKV